MAEVEKQNELPEEEVTEEVDVEIEGGEEEIPQEEQPEEDFYRNLADFDTSLSKELRSFMDKYSA